MTKSSENPTPRQLAHIENVAGLQAFTAGLAGITSLVIVFSTGAIVPTAILLGVTVYLAKRASQNIEKSNVLNPKSSEYQPDMYSTPGNMWSPYHRRGYNREKYLYVLPPDDL